MNLRPAMRVPIRLGLGAALALSTLAAGGCASNTDPSGSWTRHEDLFTCDWEGGRNQGKLDFESDGRFSEKLTFKGGDGPFGTSASGRWSVKGETLTLDLNKTAGRDEVSDSTEHLRLLFQASRQSGSLMLTLTTIVHEDAAQKPLTIDLPSAERCTAVFERVKEKPRWPAALGALGRRS